MVIQFPLKASDWYDIWKARGFLILPSRSGPEVSAWIQQLVPIYQDLLLTHMVACRVILPSEEDFIIAFEKELNISHWAVFEFDQRNPKHGRWVIDERLRESHLLGQD